MRLILAVLILGAAVALNAAPAFAGGDTDNGALFFGDGFDNTTSVEILGAAVAFNAAAAFADGNTDTGALFFGDGFDNTTTGS